MKIPRNRTTRSPVTDSTVSMIDQLLTVWPTVMPKYSFTSQNPASFTCEKNSEPAPTASTTSDTSPVDMPSTSETISELAVIVATVADPVARRISTASTQASSSTETSASLAQSASRVPMPVLTSTCLKPPPAATISRIPAMGGSEAATD